ncbi:MAG: DUF4974 domain-containing protein [Bacteroidetes bacterium]|nr:MAG: DUF4974 domain-containing protein [Bacteroidota bacterium]
MEKTPNHKHKEVKEERIDVLILKSFRGECTPEERKELDHWLEAHDPAGKRIEELRFLDEQLREVPFDLDPQTAREWERLRARLTPSQTARRRRLGWVWRIAAAVAVLLVGVWAFREFAGGGAPAIAQEWVVPVGQLKLVKLRDGSTVHLNSGSRLAVYEGYNRRHRRLLLEGEGYFEVKADPRRPFQVEAGPVEVEVVGTAFNLKAFPVSEQVQLTVVEGKVRFGPKDSTVMVERGQAVAYSRHTRTVEPLPYDEVQATAWRSGTLIFVNTPFEEALRTLERRYGVQFDNRSDIQSLTVRFERTESLEEVLEVLRTLLPVEFTREGDRIRVERRGKIQ